MKSYARNVSAAGREKEKGKFTQLVEDEKAFEGFLSCVDVRELQ